MFNKYGYSKLQLKRKPLATMENDSIFFSRYNNDSKISILLWNSKDNKPKHAIK